jgi:hypothetical protein
MKQSSTCGKRAVAYLIPIWIRDFITTREQPLNCIDMDELMMMRVDLLYRQFALGRTSFPSPGR